MKLEVIVTWPEIEGLDIHQGRVLKAAGRKAATAIRQRLRRGKEASGASVPKAKDDGAGRPLRRSGDLIRSIKVGKKAKKRATKITVGPRGSRSDGGSNKIVMSSIQKQRNLELMRFSRSEIEVVDKAATAEITRQMEKSRTGGLKVRKGRPRRR